MGDLIGNGTLSVIEVLWKAAIPFVAAFEDECNGRGQIVLEDEFIARGDLWLVISFNVGIGICLELVGGIRSLCPVPPEHSPLLGWSPPLLSGSPFSMLHLTCICGQTTRQISRADEAT